MSARVDWEEIFGPEGPLARTIPGFTMREEQIGMATAVDHALRTRGRLVVEAGTGTGKTFAYLVPALLSGGSHGRHSRPQPFTRTGRLNLQGNGKYMRGREANLYRFVPSPRPHDAHTRVGGPGALHLHVA